MHATPVRAHWNRVTSYRSGHQPLMNDLNTHPLEERTALLKQAEAALLTTDAAGALRREVLDRVAPWYLFPGTQARPRVVGLWGMTGTGKTHFVRELVRHLGLEDSTFWLDGGQLTQSHWRMGIGERLAQRFDGRPFVLVVDEFQHACSKRNGQVRDDSNSVRAFWELVDSGRVIQQTGESELAMLLDLRDELALAVEGGMRVKDGRVVAGVDSWKAMMKRNRGFDPTDDQGETGRPWVFPRSDWKWLRELMKGPLVGTIGLQRRMEELDTEGVMALVDGLVAGCSVPRVVDARQALVVVLGNLDELYALGEDPMPELDPDVLLARHEELGLTGVQELLHGLFRIEQVARLGTDQFVFPPLGREALLALGRAHVTATVARLEHTQGVLVHVDDALVRHLVEHHSIAVLGARPLLNAIERCIPDLLSRCQRMAQEREAPLFTVRLRLEGQGVRATVQAGVEEDPEDLLLPLPTSVRVPMGPNRSFERIAVHEAGHAVVGMAIYGRRPLQVCAHTSSGDKRGFVIWPRMEGSSILLKGEVVRRMAVLLAGWAAERLRYGAAGVSNGSGSDIAKATGMAVDAVKERGLGIRPAFHAQHAVAPGDLLRIGLEECDQLVRDWLDQAVVEAEALLVREQALYTAVVAALQVKGSLNATELDALVAAHGSAALRGVETVVPKATVRRARSPKRVRERRRA